MSAASIEKTRGRLPDGRSLPVFVLANATADRRFLLDESRRLLDDVQRLSCWPRRSGAADGWQAFGSYTLSRVSGLQAIERDQRLRCPGQHDRGLWQLWQQLRARSEQPDQRARTAAERSPARLPRHGQRRRAEDGPGGRGESAVLQRQAVGGDAQVPLPQGDQRILLEPPGSRRLSSQTLLDLRLSRPFTFGGVGRIDLLLDVLNALNDTAEEGISTDNFYIPNFGQPAVFVDPRRVMLGVRLNLGR